jgi:succinate dehydrogenase/fumarate reductase cytochrome b subunit
MTIGVVSLFGTSDTLHSVALALLHHVLGGIVIAVKAMGICRNENGHSYLLVRSCSRLN